MKNSPHTNNKGFTLLETVIAIGILAVLLTAFLAIFAPATTGIRRSIDLQEADRLASTLEQELVTYRSEANINNGFDKAFQWISQSTTAANALLAYQYRGSPTSLRTDGTPTPIPAANGLPGQDYVLQSIIRRKSDAQLTTDLAAVEGSVYLVKCTQLVSSANGLIAGTPGSIKDSTGASIATAAAYPEAVITFSAEFHSLPSKSASYINGSSFTSRFPNLKNPVFVRNLAVRR